MYGMGRSHATDPEDTIKLLYQIGKDAYRYTVGSYLRVLAIGITARSGSLWYSYTVYS